MQEEGITIEDLKSFKQNEGQLSHDSVKFHHNITFDVVCRDRFGGMLRVPGNEVTEKLLKSGSVIGVFPFSSKYPEKNIYIGLEESPEISQKLIRKSYKIIPLDLFNSLFDNKLVEPLNALFSKLNAPPLDGLYLASDPHNIGWSVRFRPGQETLDSDYYGSQNSGKIRSWGHYGEWYSFPYIKQ